VSVRILVGSCIDLLASLDASSVQTCVTSPPYLGLRDYGHPDQIGREATPDEYVANMVAAFRAVRRVLRDDGTLWLNLGDSYAAQGGAHGGRKDNQRGVGAKRTHDAGGGDQAARVAPLGLKPKDLIGIPWRVAFALQADGWYLRSDIIWSKPNPMPESVTDRPTKAHEYVFLLSKSERYFYDADAIAEPASEISGWAKDRARDAETWKYGRTAGGNTTNGVSGTHGTPGTRNARTVWTIATQPYKGAHFATMPPALADRCIRAGSHVGDTVLDPFGGAGTTGLVADRLRRNAILCELNPEYAALAEARTRGDAPLFTEGAV